MRNFCVYFHINPITREVFYVGKGYENRAFISYNRNNFWQNIVNKYGEPIVVIVKRNITEKYAFELEKAYIKLFGRRDLNEGTLVNLTNGGEGSSGRIHTVESKILIGESKKNNNYALGYKHSDVAKKIIGDSKKGNNYALGYKHSNKAKNKIADVQKGNTNMLGKKHSDETKKKIGDSKKGNTNMLNKIFSDEHKNNLSESKKGEKNPAFNTKWIHNLYLKKCKRVKEDSIEYYLCRGWIKGRKKFK